MLFLHKSSRLNADEQIRKRCPVHEENYLDKMAMEQTMEKQAAEIANLKAENQRLRAENESLRNSSLHAN